MSMNKNSVSSTHLEQLCQAIELAIALGQTRKIEDVRGWFMKQAEFDRLLEAYRAVAKEMKR